MNARLKRITKELEQLAKEPLEHIFIDYDESNLTHLEVLFIGPRYTPYSRMFMRFTIDFPELYPIKPPKVVFSSSYDRKIHPNVFPGGWLCLSTLNTGDDSGWVPTISLSSLLITIYSMFTKEMIMTDNTHEHEKSDKFFPGVMYDCFYIQTKLIKNEQNEMFRTIMTSYIEKHIDWYLRKLEKLSADYDGKKLDNYYQPHKADFKAFIPIFESFKS